MIPEIKKILYATDLSGSSRTTLSWAMALARKHEARLLMVNVIEEIGSGSPSLQFYLTEKEWEDLKQRINSEAIDIMKEQLNLFCDTVIAEEPECHYIADDIIVVRGNPAEKIVATAVENRCDVIVMGAIGAGGLVGTIMGSTARRVLRKSSVPVFLVPHADKPQ